MVGSYLDSPIYRQMLAQTMQGGPASQYPGQAIANGLAQALQAYTLKNLGDKEEAKRTAGNAELAKALLPEQFKASGGGQSFDIPLSGGIAPGDQAMPQDKTGQALFRSVNMTMPNMAGTLPNIQDANAGNREQLAALLNGGAISPEAIAPMALKNLGLGAAQGPIKLGKDEGLYDPNTYEALIKPRQAPMSLGRDARLVDPETGQVRVDMAPPEVNYNQPFLPDGTPNTAYQEYAIREKTAGRPSTTVNVSAEKPFSQALGTGAANLLEASSAAARGGAQTLNTVAQIRQALETGKVRAGPGTTAVQFFNQLSGGDPEKLKATRATMQGLAQLTLNARGALKGQGTITDREQELLERAVSADIDNISLEEIRQLTDVADRAARAAIKANKENVERASKIPGAGPVLDFYAVPEPAAAQQASGIIPTVRTPEEARRLPRGTRFRTPDGQERVVP